MTNLEQFTQQVSDKCMEHVSFLIQKHGPEQGQIKARENFSELASLFLSGATKIGNGDFSWLTEEQRQVMARMIQSFAMTLEAAPSQAH